MSIVDEYLDKIEGSQKVELERIRKIIKQTVPKAQEVISYGMPVFKYKDGYLIGFAAFNDHMSIFPTSFPIEALKEKLGNYKLSKGTIRFTLDNILPEAIIKELIKVRMTDISNSKSQKTQIQ